MRPEKTVRVYEVIFRDERSAGPAGDHTHVFRTTNKRAMERFEAENECLGAHHETDTPIDVFKRWQREGKV